MGSRVAIPGRSLLHPSVLAVVFTVVTLCATSPAVAQAVVVDQRLDSLTVFGRAGAAAKARGIVQTPVLEQVYYSADPLVPTVEIPLQGTHAFRSCQNTGPRGLYCLDHDKGTGAATVLRWPDPDRNPLPQAEFACADLGLSDCTALAVNLAGHVFVAGRQKSGHSKSGSTSDSLYKLVERAGNPLACPGEVDAEPGAAWITVGSGKYCARAYATKRPRILQLVMVDGAQADGFQGQGPGVLALEDGGQVAFYADRQPLAAPVVHADASKWSYVLDKKESLQGISLLQVSTADPVRNFILATSSSGRVLGYEIPWSGSRKPFHTGLTLNWKTLAVTAPEVGAPSCSASEPFDVATSARTSRTYFSAGTCVAGFDPVVDSHVNAKVPVTFTKGFGVGVEAGFTLAGVVVSPGVEIDFIRDGCIDPLPGGCNLIATDNNGNQVPAAKFAGIGLGSDASGWVMYQVTGIPDCRYLDPKPAICTPATIVDPTESGDPTRQYLNVTPLMPAEIARAVTLPARMLVQPDYHARPTSPGRAPYTFDALFGIPETGLVYRGTFDAIFDIADLMGSALGCGGGQLPANATSAPSWDVVVNISELAPTVGGPIASTFPAGSPPAVVPREFVSMLLDVDCTNPTRLAGTRGSGFFYGLQRAPQARSTQGWIWHDSTFAILLRSLARDFDANLYTYTCANLDAPAGSPAPVSAATCKDLQKDWVVTYPKLLKCAAATDKPKQSSGSEQCNAFETQFAKFKRKVQAVTLQLGAPDPQNRVGELKARLAVLEYVYFTQFKTSLKPGGFTNPNTP
jgi:hypothetical protein